MVGWCDCDFAWADWTAHVRDIGAGSDAFGAHKAVRRCLEAHVVDTRIIAMRIVGFQAETGVRLGLVAGHEMVDLQAIDAQ
jgi:hypothetical protein